MHEAGKGDSRRPMAISDQQYAQRWDLIFGRDKHETASQSNGQEDGVGLEGSAQRDGEGRDAAPVPSGNQGSNNA